jgi:glycosyltransferase involved in cell wall biosynthesis
MAKGQVGVSVVIAAHNEAENIRACVESVLWAREVIVVEDGSSDDTAAIAESAGATVIHNPFVTIGSQRNVAIARALAPWILVIDADERATPELAAEVAAVIPSAKHEAFRAPRRNFFLGREITHGGWERDRPIRLFKREHSYNEARVHEHVEVNGVVGELESALIHEPYSSFDEWLAKLRTYSRWWAEDRYNRGRRCGILTVVFRPPARFVSMYLLRGGFMDGAQGALLACMAAASVMAKYAQLWALGARRPR